MSPEDQYPPRVDRPLFSIVVPTHNGHRGCSRILRTLHRQVFDSWQLCIFDNASKVPIHEALISLDCSKVKMARTDEKFSVTDSWNAALDLADGEYVVFLGDDDDLFIDSLIDSYRQLSRFNFPDMCVSPVIQYFESGVLGTRPQIRWHHTLPAYARREAPGLLSSSSRNEIIRRVLSMSRDVYLVMPSVTFKKEAVWAARPNSDWFTGFFPDYLFILICLAKLPTILVSDAPVSVQGISPNSFGGNLLQQREEQSFTRIGTKAWEIAEFDPPTPYSINQLGSRYLRYYIDTLILLKTEIDDQHLLAFWSNALITRLIIFDEISALFRTLDEYRAMTSNRVLQFRLWPRVLYYEVMVRLPWFKTLKLNELSFLLRLVLNFLIRSFVDRDWSKEGSKFWSRFNFQRGLASLVPGPTDPLFRVNKLSDYLDQRSETES